MGKPEFSKFCRPPKGYASSMSREDSPVPEKPITNFSNFNVSMKEQSENDHFSNLSINKEQDTWS